MQVCGRNVEVKQPIILPKIKYRYKSYVRYIVEGVNHPKSGPIRFKSIENAERHILNMGLSLSK